MHLLAYVLSILADNLINLLMERVDQDDREFAPWSHDETLPRNIIIQFQKSNNGVQKDRRFLNDSKKKKLSANLDRFIEKRRLRLQEKYSKRQSESPPQVTISGEHKIPIKNIEPQALYLNETVQISQLFPSYGLKGSQIQLNYYKPHRYQSNERTETREQKGKRSPIRYSFKPRQQNISQLARNLSSNSKLHFSITKRSFRDNEQKVQSVKYSLSKSEKGGQQVKQGTKCNFTIKKQANKTQRFEDILSFLNKRIKEKPALLRTKSSADPTELDKCLKAKKQFYLNLPKIQFIQIDH